MTQRIDLRLPDHVSHMVTARAERVGLSRNAWLVRAVQWALTQPIKTDTEQVRI